MRALFAAALMFLPASAFAAAPGVNPAAYAGAGEQTMGKQLDGLFQSLAKAGSQEEAQPLEQQILALFLQSGSDSIDLLMSRAAEALKAGDVATSKKLLASVTEIEPHYAEGWHQLARLEQASGDDRAAMVALQQTLALNPRQFEAYAELAGMLEDYGDKPGALAMYRKAADLDPQMDDLSRHIRELSRAVEGQGI